MTKEEMLKEMYDSLNYILEQLIAEGQKYLGDRYIVLEKILTDMKNCKDPDTFSNLAAEFLHQLHQFEDLGNDKLITKLLDV